jgi:hypothetical protein
VIATPLELLAGAARDEAFWSCPARLMLLHFTEMMMDDSNRESSVKGLVSAILRCTTESCEFVSYVKILSLILVAPLNIAAEARELTIFLLPSLAAFPPKIKGYCCLLLKKLLNFLSFEKQKLNKFFLYLFNLFIMQNSGALDPFTDYFIQVVDYFAADIEFPRSAVEQIEPTDPCFFIISILKAKLNSYDPDPVLHRASERLRQLIAQAKFKGPALRNQLAQGVSCWLTLLDNVQLSDYPYAAEMINLLVQSNNALIDMSNQPNTALLFTPIIETSARVILTFASFDSAHIVSLLAEMSTPEFMSRSISQRLPLTLWFLLRVFCGDLPIKPAI